MFPTILAAAGNATAEAGKSGLFETFGVSGWLLLAQFINFIIVIIVLKKFAFGPIQAMLEQRKNRIAEGEEKLKRIEQQLADSEQRTQEGQLVWPGHVDTVDSSSAMGTTDSGEDVPSAAFMLLPILTMVIAMPASLYVTGNGSLID